MHRVALPLVSLWLVAVVTTASQETASISVSSAGSPAAGVDIFVFVNQGKKPVGTTNDQGSLPFDPALLVGKLEGEVVERTCSAFTEVILVAEGEDYRCESSDANGESCDCEPAGVWIFSNGRITVQMQSTAPTPLVRNPVFLGAVGAGAVTGLVVAGGGNDSSSTVTRPTTSSSLTTGVSTAPEGGATATTPSLTSLNGSYPGNFVLQRDECNFFVPSFNGTAIVQASPNGSLMLQIVESITRTYQGTLNLTSNGNGSGSATGSGTIGNLIINHEARLTFTNGRLTIEETIRKPQGGNCAAIYRAQNLARQ